MTPFEEYMLQARKLKFLKARMQNTGNIGHKASQLHWAKRVVQCSVLLDGLRKRINDSLHEQT